MPPEFPAGIAPGCDPTKGINRGEQILRNRQFCLDAKITAPQNERVRRPMERIFRLLIVVVAVVGGILVCPLVPDPRPQQRRRLRSRSARRQHPARHARTITPQPAAPEPSSAPARLRSPIRAQPRPPHPSSPQPRSLSPPRRSQPQPRSPSFSPLRPSPPQPRSRSGSQPRSSSPPRRRRSPATAPRSNPIPLHPISVRRSVRQRFLPPTPSAAIHPMGSSSPDQEGSNSTARETLPGVWIPRPDTPASSSPATPNGPIRASSTVAAAPASATYPQLVPRP